MTQLIEKWSEKEALFITEVHTRKKIVYNLFVEFDK